MIKLLITLHLVFLKFTSGDKIILTQNNQQYFDILTKYNPTIQEINEGNQSNQQIITQLRSANGDHYLTYYHIIDERITLCIDYDIDQYRKKVNISIDLNDYYLQELLLQIKIDKKEQNISIILKKLNGLFLIQENIEINQLQFDEWWISEQLENFKSYQGLIKYRQDYLNYLENKDFNNQNIMVLQYDENERINNTIFRYIQNNLLTLKLLSNENIKLMLDGQKIIFENQIIEWNIVNFIYVEIFNLINSRQISPIFIYSTIKINLYGTKLLEFQLKNCILQYNSNMQIQLSQVNYIEFSNISFANYSYQRSNVINIQLNNNQDNLMVNLTNLLFQRCQFKQSTFIKYITFKRNVTIQLENIVFQNSTFSDFTFFQGQLESIYEFTTKVILKNVQFQNCNFLNSNIFDNFQRIEVTNLSFYKGIVINSYVFLLYNSLSINNLLFEDFNFINSKLVFNEYHQMYLNIFIYINNFLIQDTIISGSLIDTTDDWQYYPIKVYLIDFQMKNAKLSDASQLFNIKADYFRISNFIMPSLTNLFNFYFRDSKEVIIENGIIDGEAKDSDGIIISISKVDDIIISNVSFINLKLQDQPILYLHESKFKSFVQFKMMDCRIQDIIFITHSNNNLLFLDSGLMANIKFEGLTIKNISFDIQKNKGLSVGSLFFIFLISGNVQIIGITVENVDMWLKDKTFFQSPIIYSSSDTFILEDSKFLNINYNAQILNQGGISKIFADNIYIQRNFIQHIKAKAGGAFFIRQYKHSNFIKVKQCNFLDIQVSDQLNGNGGVLNFDTLDGRFNLKIHHNIVENVTTSQIGGFVYISPQIMVGNISIMNNTITNVYAQENSLVKILAQGQCRIEIKNLYVSNQQYLKQYLYSGSSQIQIEAKLVKIQNFTFIGNTNEGVLDLRQNQDIILQQILIQNSVFYESTILQILSSQNQKLNLRIDDLIIINCKILQYDFLNNRLLTESNKNQLILILTNSDSNINLQRIQLKNNQCNYCQLGQFNIINGVQTTYAHLNNFQFLNNFGSNYGLLYLENITQLNIFYGAFSNNQAKINGAITAVDSQIYISESQLVNNNNNHLLIDNKSKIYIHNTQMVHQSDSIHQMEYINDQLFINQVVNGHNFGLKPVNIRLKYKQQFLKSKLTQKDQKIIETTLVQPYRIFGSSVKQNLILMPSMQTVKYQYYDPYTLKNIDYDLSYSIVMCDHSGDQIKNYQIDTLLKIDSYIYNLTSQVQIKYIGQQFITYDQIIDGFPLKQLDVKFDPYSDNNLCYQAQIQSDLINSDYVHIINLRTFRCQIGEYLYQFQCRQCDQNQGQYSLQYDQNKCQIVDKQIIQNFEHNRVELKPGLWRQSILSNQFLFCEKYNSCVGGWFAGDQQCLVGYVGPLCEECDYDNIRGDGYFANEKQECKQCIDLFNKIINTIFTIAFILVITNLIIRNVEDQIKKYLKYFLSFKQYDIIYRLDQSQLNTFIKLFLQTMILYSTIDRQNQMIFNILFITHPIQHVHFNINCLITLIYNNPKHIHIISQIIIFLIISIFQFFILLILNHKNKIKIVNLKFFGSLLFYFIYFQPDIIHLLVSFMSVRQIGDLSFVKGNLLFEFTSQYHLFWMIYIIIPLFCIIGITIPSLIYYFLYKIRLKLTNKYNRLRFSILFEEYKQNLYYFELIKILLKQIIIIILISDFQLYTIEIGFAILYIYQKLLINHNPYNQRKVNQFEIEITSILLIQLIVLFIINYLDKKDIVKEQLKYYFNFLYYLIIFKFIRLILDKSRELLKFVIYKIFIIFNKYQALQLILPGLFIKLQDHIQTNNRIKGLFQQLRYHLKVTGKVVSRRANQNDQLSFIKSRNYTQIDQLTNIYK